jgi:Protein of unknown function (DUF2934)
MARQLARAPSEPDGKPGTAKPVEEQSSRPEPDEHRIRTRAHAIWIEDGKPDGRDVDHWLRARWEIEGN